MSNKRKSAKIIIEEDKIQNTKDTPKNNKKKTVIVKNDKLSDIDQLNTICKLYEKGNTTGDSYKSDCIKLYKLYTKIEKFTPKLLTVAIKKRILNTIFNDIITYDEKCNSVYKPYYLYKDLTKIPNNVQIMMEFDRNFFKYYTVLQNLVLRRIDTYTNANKHRCIYIKYIIDNTPDSKIHFNYSSKDNIISHKTHRLSSGSYDSLTEYLEKSCYDIDLNKIFELCNKGDIVELISYLDTVKNQEYVETIKNCVENYFKKNYNDNNNKLLLLEMFNTCYCIDVKLSQYSPILKYVIQYTDCYELSNIVNMNNETDINMFIDIIQQSQHNEQKKNILQELFDNRYNMLKKRNKVYDNSTHINKYLKENKFTPLNTLVQTIQEYKPLMLEMFKLIFSKLTPSLEYMHILIQMNEIEFSSIGFRLMLNEGIIPTEETLELACRYLYCQDIYLIIERKILPTTKNLITYIAHNPSTHHPYNTQSDNADIDTVLNLFFECGLQMNDELVEALIKKKVNINFAKYNVEYTMNMYNLFGKYNCVISDENIKQFSFIPGLQTIITFKDAVERRTWKSISKLGFQNKIIPDQDCLDSACKSPYSDVPLCLLHSANIISLTNEWRINTVKDDEYVKFLFDKKIPIALTKQNIKDLLERDRIECLGYISYSFVQIMDNNMDNK